MPDACTREEGRESPRIHSLLAGVENPFEGDQPLNIQLIHVAAQKNLSHQSMTHRFEQVVVAYPFKRKSFLR